MFGICLGHQLMALAIGAKTHKMRFGHRGVNHPVKDLDTDRTYITSQNHGYAVVGESVDPSIARVRYVNLNDGSVEGIEHIGRPVFTVQFHPEVCPGPMDTSFLFDRFLSNIDQAKGDAGQMPLRSDIKKVMVLGSGPIVIGQAAEFDYAGTQACRALREEGLEVVLVNSNPATHHDRQGHG